MRNTIIKKQRNKNMKKQLRYLILGTDEQLQWSELLACVCFLGFAIQIVICLTTQNFDDGKILGLTTMASYTVLNKVSGKINGHANGNGNGSK